MKKKEQCEVLRQEELLPGIMSLTIRSGSIADNARPGQFILVYSKDHAKLLGRPISLCGIDPEAGTVRLVYRVTGAGTGTEEFSAWIPGDQVLVLGPLGNGFPLEEASGRHLLLVGGGIGIPPLLETARQHVGPCTAVLGYRDSLFLQEEFDPYASVLVSTEDGSEGFHGNTVELLRAMDIQADIVFACGPIPMLKALSAWAQEKQIPCWLSLEERMACGIGACLGCVCRTKETDSHSHVKNARICKDGPVFRSTEVEL